MLQQAHEEAVTHMSAVVAAERPGSEDDGGMGGGAMLQTNINR